MCFLRFCFLFFETGYCMYSSSTILVFTMGNGVNGFTLDPQIGEFVMTHPNIQVPKRGKVRGILPALQANMLLLDRSCWALQGFFWPRYAWLSFGVNRRRSVKRSNRCLLRGMFWLRALL